MTERGEKGASPGRALWAAIRRDPALACFVAYCLAAYPLILFHFGKNEWFVQDDWNLILPEAAPTIFSPVEHHWSTVPILLFRAYFQAFGANYFVFLATVSALHLGTTALLRTLMRRAGVQPWTASLTSALLVLFGAGYMSIVFSIQITQNLSLVLGLGQMVLADHDGSLDRRDWSGLFLGALSLMSSGLAPILTLGLGLGTLVRRGWRAAAFHTVPLGAMYVAWSSRHKLGQADMYRLPYSESHPFAFAWDGLQGSIRALAHFDAIALAIALILAVGLPMALLRRDEGSRRTGTPMAVALLCCAPLYFAVIGLQRSRLSASYALFSHHVYTAVCFTLPALACAADALARRYKPFGPLAAAVALLLLSLNVRHFGADELRDPPNRTSITRLSSQLILSVANSPYATLAQHVDRTKLVYSWYAPHLTLGWALDQAQLGRLAKPGPIPPELEDHVELFYGITDIGYPPKTACTEELETLDIQPKQGDVVGVGSGVTVTNVRQSATSRATLPFFWPEGAGHALRIELPGMRLRLTPLNGKTSFLFCRGSFEAESFSTFLHEQLNEAIKSDPKAMDSLREALRRDPKAMEEIKKAMIAAQASASKQ